MKTNIYGKLAEFNYSDKLIYSWKWHISDPLQNLSVEIGDTNDDPDSTLISLPAITYPYTKQ